MVNKKLIEKAVKSKIELEEIILSNFTGEHNTWGDIMNKLNEFEEATIKSLT